VEIGLRVSDGKHSSNGKGNSPALSKLEWAFSMPNNVVLMNSLGIQSTWSLKSPLAHLFQRGVPNPFSGFRISAARSVLVRNDAVSDKRMKSPKD
jgi:hypothetical protein